MNNELSYVFTGVGIVLAGAVWYDAAIKPLKRFERQSGLRLRELDIAKAMTLDRIINVLNSPSANKSQREEFDMLLDALPEDIQTVCREFKRSYIHTEQIARTIYGSNEIKKYLSEKKD